MARPKLHDAALRARLLDRAAELLSEKGQQALSLRRLAADAGTSTTAVYSLFGGKPGLLAAVYDEAERRFAEHLAAVRPTGDPMSDLRQLGDAYYRSAVGDPHLYTVMFSRSGAARERPTATFAPLVDAVRRAIERGQLPPCDPIELATACWAMAHGVVSLQLARLLPREAGSAGELFTRALRAVTAGWRQPVDSAPR